MAHFRRKRERIVVHGQHQFLLAGAENLRWILRPQSLGDPTNDIGEIDVFAINVDTGDS